MNRNIHPNEHIYLEPIGRAWSRLILDAAKRGDGVATRALSDFWSRNQYRALYHIREIVKELRGESVDNSTPLTPDEWRQIDEELGEVLDLRPPSKAGKDEIRPTWPMTLAQLRAQVEREFGPIKNPAPLILKDKSRPNADLSFGASDLRSFKNIRERSKRDYDAIQGMAWKKAAPEGFPPIPRKGGVYSKHEASAIFAWIRDQWPVIQDAKRIAAEHDREMLDGQADPKMLGHIKYGTETFTRWLEGMALDWHMLNKMNAHGDTPKELWASMLTWAKNHLLPATDALQTFDIKLFKKWSDPDAHLAALNGNLITQSSAPKVAEHMYGLQRWHADWMKPLVGEQAVPTEYLIGSGREKTFKLSFLLAEQKKAEKAKEEKEAARIRTLKSLAPAVASLVGRNVNKAKLSAALPAGYRVEEMGLLVTIYGPKDTWIEGAREATVTKSYAELIRKIVES